MEKANSVVIASPTVRVTEGEPKLKTHTVRHKNKDNPIITLTPTFLSMMLKARPEASTLVWLRITAQYKNLTGKKPKLHHEQEAALMQKTPAELSDDQTLIANIFEAGFRDMPLASISLEKSLEVADAFYKMLLRLPPSQGRPLLPRST